MSETLIERAYRILLEENKALSERLSKAERTVYDQSAQIEMVCKLWNAAQPDIVRLFEIQPTFGDNETEVDGQACHELQQVFAKINWHCVPDVKAERDALVARNHELIGLVLRMRERWWPFVHGSVAPSQAAYRLGKESADIISKTPRQCLLDVQAEAGRLGYVEGRTSEAMLRAGRTDLGDYNEVIEKAANNYAATVRKGGAE